MADVATFLGKKDDAPAEKSVSSFLAPKEGRPPRTVESISNDLGADVATIAASAPGFVNHYIEDSRRSASKLPDGSPILNQVMGQADKIRKRMPSAQADYDVGLPWHVRAHLSAADPVNGDKERQLVIKKFMPDAEISYDPGGRLMVKPKGSQKWIAADGGGFWSGMSADLIGNAAPTAGGITALTAVTPEMTAMAAGGGPVGVLGATGLGLAALYGGGMAGKGLDEIRKWVQGLYAKSSSQEQKEAQNKAGHAAVTGELIGRGISGVFKGFRRYPEMLGGQTTESKRLVEDLLKRDYRPGLDVAAPESTRPGYVQNTIDKMSKSIRHAQNAQALENDIKSTLKILGMTDDEVDHAMQQILTKQVDARQYGESLAGKVQEYVKTGEESLKDGREAITEKLTGDLGKLQKSIGEADMDTLHRIQEDIAGGKSQMSAAYGKQYEGIWKLAGETSNFDTSAIRSAAEDLLRRLPPTAKAEIAALPKDVLDELPDYMRAEIEEAGKAAAAHGDAGVQRIFIGENKELLNELIKITHLAPEITPQQAHTLRSQFKAMERNSDFSKNFAGWGRGKLTDALEVGFDDLEKKMPGFSTQLRDVNRAYRTDIAKFDNASVQQIMREQRLGGSIAPERVLDFVKNPNHFKEIWDVITPETRQAVAALDFRQMINAATDAQSGVIDGRAFAKQLKQRADIGPDLYGRRYSDAVKIAEKYAALDGQVSRGSIGPGSGDFVGDLERVVRAEEDFNKQLVSSGGWLKSLGKEGIMGERAMKLTVTPGAGGESRLLEAQKFYGKDSPQMDKMRKYALVKLFADAAEGEQNTIADAIQSGNLKKSWNRWSAAQKEVLFGDMVPEIDGLIARVDAVTPKPEGLGFGSLAAGSVNLGGIATWPITALAMIGDRVMASPGIIRWFAGTVGERPLPGRPFTVPRDVAELRSMGTRDQFDRLMRNAMDGLRAAPGTAARIISRGETQASKDYRQP